MLQYLDDSLFLSQSRQGLLRVREFVDETFTRLGLKRKESKGCWEPTKDLVHLGIRIDSRRGLFLVPPAKQDTIRGAAASLLRYASSHRRWVSTRRLANLCGLVISLTVALPVSRTVTRSLYDAIGERSSWNKDVQLSNQALRDLRFLRDLPDAQCNKAIWEPRPLSTIHTDASDTGWGAVLQNIVPAQGFFRGGQQALHITAKELTAVLSALERFQDQLKGQPVRIITDNMAVRAVINKGTSKSSALMKLYRSILRLTLEKGIMLSAEYIPTLQNVQADALSRIVPSSDWSLPHHLFEEAEELFGERTIDRFASPTSAKCVRYNSVIPSPTSYGDAFLHSWEGERNWVCPPISLAAPVVSKLYSETAEAVVVLPYWQSAPWFPILQEMATHIRVLTPEEMRMVVAHGTDPPEVHRNRHWKLCMAYIPSRHRKLIRF